MATRRKKKVVKVGLLSAPYAARLNRLRFAGVLDDPAFQSKFIELTRQYVQSN